MPRFSVQALLGVALPLLIITLTGQYMPGMLVLRNDGFKTSANPILTVTGLGSLIMAPFGAHAFNVAAITAAICTGQDAHPDARKRYVAGLACGAPSSPHWPGWPCWAPSAAAWPTPWPTPAPGKPR
ncbi:hypothetical protein G6F68_017072 [Rhizopus microsporus]|nr:hypothetical protein G6F68_017072 [Rhizopus microsporus]